MMTRHVAALAILLLLGCGVGCGGSGDGGTTPRPVDATPPGGQPGGFITYMVGADVFRIESQAGATPVNVSAALEGFDPGEDESPSVSRNGEWLTISTTRFDPECDGFSCLAVVEGNLSAGESVIIGGEPLRPDGRTSISNDGLLIVYPSDGGPHDIDLFASRKSGSTWSAPVLLTEDSPHAFNELPVLSSDAERVLFDCGPVQYGQNGTGVCEVGADGTGFQRIVAPQDNPLGSGSTDAIAHHADYMPDGGILFEADWDSEQVWMIPGGAESPIRAIPEHSNDNSPCSLPGGFAASLWLGRPEGSGVHELKVMAPDGSEFVVLTPDIDIADIGMSCHE